MLNLWFDLCGSLATAMAGEESGIVRKLMLKLTAKIAALLPTLQLVVWRKKSGDFRIFRWFVTVLIHVIKWHGYSFLHWLLGFSFALLRVYWIGYMYFTLPLLSWTIMDWSCTLLTMAGVMPWLEDEGNKNYIAIIFYITVNQHVSWNKVQREI